MVDSLAKGYEHKEIEARWYAKWQDGGYFKASDESDAEPYCIVIPPPNVTGQLHMGHGLTFAIQDLLIRWKRMSGFNTLWLPGTDHAGIATQMVVERELQKDGVSRFDLGRRAFVDKVWEWKRTYRDRITSQMTALGVSVDWDRERFTLDEGLSRAVREVFVRLYEEGLIYRAQRMVNWSPGIQTVLSDLEVEERELKSHLWHIAYPVVGSDQKIIVATTRPETMLGDTAIAVHPDDERYKHLVGQKCQLPLTDRQIPIIADAELVDMAFGTGAVKITPAHDFNDFETGKRHNLEIITILDRDARLNDQVPEKYRGMDRFVARTEIVKDLEEIGCLVQIEDYTHRVGHCQRSGAVIEPMVSQQWFVHTAPLAEKAIQAVKDGRTEFIPPMWEKTYMNWMEGIRDWCISRQLWWGHQIPVWYCSDETCGGMIVSREEVGPDADCPICGKKGLKQDEDVLDTWFSSGLWAFSTLGWPDETKALKTFYPTTVMETGFDIIFFWVARMMMMGLHFMGDVPFRKVYLHAMVRDEHGLKMSKTKGNVIDPLSVVEEVGSDALRFTLVNMTAQGRDIKLSMDRLKGYREFVNKLWNAARFVFINLEDFEGRTGSGDLDGADLTSSDRWILTRMKNTLAENQKALEEFRFNEASNGLYQFTWHQFCDWYLELSKGPLAEGGERRRTTQKVLIFVLDRILRALHPFMPYVTEEVWQKLRPYLTEIVPEPTAKGASTTAVLPDSIMIAPYPVGGDVPVFVDDAKGMDAVLEVITAIRGTRAQTQVPPSEKVTVTIKPHSEDVAEYLAGHTDNIERLGRVEGLVIDQFAVRPSGAAVVVGASADCFVVIGESRIVAEIARLQKDLAKNEKELEKLENKLSNPQFIEKAAEDVIDEVREKAENFSSAIARIGEALHALNG